MQQVIAAVDDGMELLNCDSTNQHGHANDQVTERAHESASEWVRGWLVCE